MKLITNRRNSFSHYLLLIFSFLFPLSVFAGNLLAILLISLWLYEGKFKEKLEEILQNKVIVAYLLFFLAHIFGLLWSDNWFRGVEVVRKMLEYGVLLPVLYTLIKPENRRTYLYTFLSSITFIVLTSDLIWLELIEPFKNASVHNPTPFMTHITHTPLVAFGSFIIGNLIFDSKVKSVTNKKFVFLILLFILFSINVFITEGRTGQIAYIVLFFLLFFQNFELTIKNLLKIFIGISLILIAAYNLSEAFNKRLHQAIDEINNYQNNPHTNVGIRIKFAENSIPFILENPFFGVGTGDFSSEYKKVNDIKSPTLPVPNNPHNMYIIILGQLGLFGLFLLFYGFYQQFKCRDKKDFFTKRLGSGLIVFFLLINLGDSYMLGHFTSFVFVFLTALLFTSNEKE